MEINFCLGYDQMKKIILLKKVDQFWLYHHLHVQKNYFMCEDGCVTKTGFDLLLYKVVQTSNNFFTYCQNGNL
jgi:hypothetical protein